MGNVCTGNENKQTFEQPDMSNLKARKMMSGNSDHDDPFSNNSKKDPYE